MVYFFILTTVYFFILITVYFFTLTIAYLFILTTVYFFILTIVYFERGKELKRSLRTSGGPDSSIPPGLLAIL
jgi:hypothetical protein